MLCVHRIVFVTNTHCASRRQSASVLAFVKSFEICGQKYCGNAKVLLLFQCRGHQTEKGEMTVWLCLGHTVNGRTQSPGVLGSTQLSHQMAPFV